MTDEWLLVRPDDGPLWALSRTQGLQHVAEDAWRSGEWRVAHAKLLGTPLNAPVIYKLMEQGATVELGTPLLVTGGKQRKPAHVLRAMSQVADTWLGPARGGWHVATEMDRLTYGMSDPGLREDLWQQHPLRRVLQLVPGLSLEYAGRLVAEVRDPRWYIDLASPNRGAKLQAYLCNDALKKITRRVWRTEREATGDTNFLWQAWHTTRQYKNEEMASRVVDRRFVDFLRYCWLAIVSLPEYPQLFDPARFLEGETLREFLQGVRTFAPYEWCLGA